MARGINKVILVGNVGVEPDKRHLPNGNAVTTLSLATSESWKDKQTGEKKEMTEWHRIVCFNRLGEIAGEYVKKGSKLYIEGRLRTRKWQDPQGQDRYTTEIIANEMQLLDSRTSPQDNNAPYASATAPSFAAPAPALANADPFDELNDDVPF